jgi:hypothetical protein
MAVTDIYLVSDRINPVNPRDVDKLERAIGSLPCDYRGFMTHCGREGELCDEIRVWDPRLILGNVEKERKYQTWEHCTAYRDPGPLTPDDFRDLWPFGTTVNGDSLVYFPRHPGTLFNIRHGEDRIARHPRAFSEAWGLGGSRSHPFPYFDPKGKHRRHRSFQIETRRGTAWLARFAAAYWAGGGVHRVRMPRGSYGDTVMVFVRRIGGQIQFTYEPENDPDEVYGGTTFDRGFTREVKAFERELYGQVEAAA